MTLSDIEKQGSIRFHEFVHLDKHQGILAESEYLSKTDNWGEVEPWGDR